MKLISRDRFGHWFMFGTGPKPIRKVQEPNGASHREWDRWCIWVDGHIRYETINGKQELINMRTITIELRFDAEEEDKHEVLKDAAMQAAKHLYTSALLISAKRKPQISMYTSDMFAGAEEINLAESLNE